MSAPTIPPIALIQKAWTKPDSPGTRPPATAPLARSTAPICAPITPPTMRMTVFMPFATPVSEGSTESTISLGIAANANPIPRPQTANQVATWPAEPWNSAMPAAPSATSSMPATSGLRDPISAAQDARDRPAQEHGGGRRQDPHAGHRHGRPEPIVGERRQIRRQPAGQLEELRQDHPRHVERKTRDQRRQVGEQHRTARQHAHVDHRLWDTKLHHAPDDEQHGGRGEQTQDGGGSPAPCLALGACQEQRDERGGQERRARDVHARPGADR